MGNTLVIWTHPGPYPETDGEPKFDTNLGFPKGRKKRVAVASEQEMMAVQVPMEARDYCAHHYIDYQGCMRIHYPFWLNCEKYQHKYADCQYEDYVLRMKEYERERRLLLREQRKQAAAA